MGRKRCRERYSREIFGAWKLICFARWNFRTHQWVGGVEFFEDVGDFVRATGFRNPGAPVLPAR